MRFYYLILLIALLAVATAFLPLPNNARADDDPAQIMEQVQYLDIGVCKRILLHSQYPVIKVCRNHQGGYEVVPDEGCHADFQKLSAEFDAIESNTPGAYERLKALQIQVLGAAQNTAPRELQTDMDCVNLDNELADKIVNKLNEIAQELAKEQAQEAAKQAQAAVEEAQQRAIHERELEAQSSLLSKVNAQYPGLLDRSVGSNELKLGKFLLCLQQKKDAADWSVTRDRGGVHLSGLMYQQSVNLDFIDHGDRLEIVGASYGERVSLTSTDANGVLGELELGCY